MSYGGLHTENSSNPDDINNSGNPFDDIEDSGNLFCDIYIVSCDEIKWDVKVANRAFMIMALPN